MVEGARLESVYTSKGYRGFESLTLRIKNKCPTPAGHFFWQAVRGFIENEIQLQLVSRLEDLTQLERETCCSPTGSITPHRGEGGPGLFSGGRSFTAKIIFFVKALLVLLLRASRSLTSRRGFRDDNREPACR